jgi:hypothetical protein
MSREKVKTYRYTCDGMKPVTHAEDGREYTQPMVTLCKATAEFVGVDHWDADHQAQEAGWKIDGYGAHYCDPNHA